jgi:DNA oxidative demethylase
MTTIEIASGVILAPNYLDRAAQENLRDAVREIAGAAPLFRPRMPRTGKAFSVRMTNCGELGWVSDERGYRYQATHPETGALWPQMPAQLLAAWSALAPGAPPPQACLVNYYDAGARMGLHQDRDEEDLTPVVSLSLGDTCQFRLGGVERAAPTHSFKLHSGDAMALGGASRLAYHGVDKIYPDTSTLLAAGGRINLTLRRVTRAPD